MSISGLWLVLPTGPIRISTVALAIAMLIILAWRRNLVIAVIAVIAWLAAFESLYAIVGAVAFHWPISPVIWEVGALSGWVILAAVLGIRPQPVISGIFIVLMAIWIATGYRYNLPHGATFNGTAEILNELAKTTLGLAYLAGSLRLRIATPDGRIASAAASVRYPSPPAV